MGTNRKIPDLWLEQYLLGELPPERAAEVQRLEQTDPDVSRRLEALRRSNQAILEKYPPRVIAAGVDQRAAAGRKPSPALRWAAIGAPAVAALALVVWITRGPTPEQADPSSPRPVLDAPHGRAMLDPGTRLKGDATLLLYRVTPSDSASLRGDAAESEPLTDGAAASPGDVIQLKYLAAGSGFGMVLSIDGRGTVTLHFPEEERGETTLVPGGATPLPRSYELDDAPDFERFILVTSAEPIPVAEILESARTLGADPIRPLPLAVGFAQKSILLRKAGKVAP
jgi:hypothetical protein